MARILVLVLLALSGFACSHDSPDPFVGEGSDYNLSWTATRDPATDRLTSTLWIGSDPWLDSNQTERYAWLGVTCSPTQRIVLLRTEVFQPSGEVSWRIDDGPEVDEVWTRPFWGLRGDLTPPLSRAMLDALKGGALFSIETGSTAVLIFSLEGALETPVQGHIDNCGQEGWE